MSGWIDRIEALCALTAEDRALLARHGQIIEAPAGHAVFGYGMTPENMLLVLSGTVRVQHMSDTGREIVLYRIEAGQSCVLTTACLLADEAYAAEAITETKVEAVAISGAGVDALLTRSAVFRRFVFGGYGRRVADLFRVIDEVAFGRIDARLAARLITFADADGVIRTTHQDLATELGSAREVVSRQLQEFQRRGWISMSRGSVRLTDRAALSDLSD
ncbi:MAG: Crp/Fnr family transcriptional regulator [Pseudomonadota bacterium]